MTLEFFEPKKDLTIEDFKKIYNDLNADKIHKELGGIPLYCYCASCLYQFCLLEHKNSKLRKDNFFLGWVLYQTAEGKKKNGKIALKYNWKAVEDIIFQISGRKFVNLQYESKNCGSRGKYEKYRIASRYVKIVSKAFKDKLLFDNDPVIKRLIYIRAYWQALKKIVRKDEKFEERVFNYVKEKGVVNKRQFLRHFSSRERIEGSVPRDLKNNLGMSPHFERDGEIFLDQDKKKIFYVNKDKLNDLAKRYKSSLASK
jgi:hypothetical protein